MEQEGGYMYIQTLDHALLKKVRTDSVNLSSIPVSTKKLFYEIIVAGNLNIIAYDT